MLWVDHDKIILLPTSFPSIPMLGEYCCCNGMLCYVGNKRCCIVLYNSIVSISMFDVLSLTLSGP